MLGCFLKSLALFTLFSVCLSSTVRADDPGNQSAMMDRILHPDRSKKSSYQGKTFDPGQEYGSREFVTGEYAGTKQFESKSFTTKMFEGAKESWIGKKLFPEKKLPENLQGTNREAGKQFASSSYATKNYGDLDKKSCYGDHEAFSTREITLKGKTQGALDNDLQLQEAVKKGLSIDDVRKLLNKVP